MPAPGDRMRVVPGLEGRGARETACANPTGWWADPGERSCSRWRGIGQTAPFERLRDNPGLARVPRTRGAQSWAYSKVFLVPRCLKKPSIHGAAVRYSTGQAGKA